MEEARKMKREKNNTEREKKLRQRERERKLTSVVTPTTESA